MAFFKPNDVFAGRYQLEELMGEGDFSEVWTAKDQLVGDTMVVLKMYAPGKGMNEVGIQQYRREFSLSQNLSHPHLLKISHFDVSEGIAYQVLPFCPLGTLSRLKAEGPFNERQVALVMSQIGSALAALHRQDPPILHQDVKPGNIVRSGPDTFLLANFEISSLPTQILPEATSGPKSVTIAYTPPETFDRFLKTRESGDIYSLGVSLFEMCTTTIPWHGGGGQTIGKAGQSLLNERHNRYIGQLPKHYSPELNELLHACMSLNNFKRPSAEELHLRGQNFLETGHWNLPETVEEEASPLQRFKPHLQTAVIAVFLIIGAISAYLAYFDDTAASSVEMQQQIGASVNMAEQLSENELLIDMLEDKLGHLEQRALVLEDENKKLLYKDSVNAILLKKQQLSEKDQIAKKEVKASTVMNKRGKKPVLASAPTSKTAKDNTTFITKELEQLLNRISDPQLSEKERIAWKKETMTYFSEAAVRILDESGGAPRQYSASIFLNLLFNVPHTIVVKEVKTDQHKKVTELRLNMQTKM